VKIVRVTERALIEETFRMRYRMFCEELCEFDSKDYPDGMETDDYDRYAEHYVVYSRGGDIMGSFRLI
jgi:N-acyl amino acid synthase of PEP-CTERM/exosortase system